MAREDVNVKVSANVAEALRMWKAMEAGPQGMANELSALGEKGKQSASGMAGEFDKLIGKWAAIGQVIEVTKGLLKGFFDEMKRLREESESTTFTIEENVKRLGLQSGLRGQALEQARGTITDIAQRRGVSHQAVFDSATQLISSGVPVNAVVGQGGAVLNEFVGGQQAMAALGVDPGAQAKGIAAMLKANGEALTAENFRKIQVATRGLYMGTDLQATHLTRYAQDSATVAKATGLTAPEQLTELSLLLDQGLDVARASTAMRAATTRMRTSQADATVQRGLGRIGLSAEDIDMEGENYETALGRIIGAMEQVDGAVQAAAAKDIFGAEGLPFFNSVGNREARRKAAERNLLTTDVAGYEEAIEFASTGRVAERAAAQVGKEAALYDPTIPDEKTIRDRLQTEFTNQGRSPARQSLDWQLFEWKLWATGDPEEAAASAIGTEGFFSLSQDMPATQRVLGREGVQRVFGQDGMNALQVDIRIKDPNGNAMPHEVEATRQNAQ